MTPAAPPGAWIVPALYDAIAGGEDAVDGDRSRATAQLGRLREQIVSFERLIDDLLEDGGDLVSRQFTAHRAVDALLETHDAAVEAIDAVSVVAPFDRVRAVMTDLQVAERGGSG